MRHSLMVETMVRGAAISCMPGDAGMHGGARAMSWPMFWSWLARSASQCVLGQ